jgi:hypothetical protein
MVKICVMGSWSIGISTIHEYTYSRTKSQVGVGT